MVLERVPIEIIVMSRNWERIGCIGDGGMALVGRGYGRSGRKGGRCQRTSLRESIRVEGRLGTALGAHGGWWWVHCDVVLSQLGVAYSCLFVGRFSRWESS
mgnify:CR=1 FL=1